MEIIQIRTQITTTYYQAEFFLKADPTRGFAFDCDKKGVLKNRKHEARVTELLQHPDYQYKGIKERHRTYRQPAIGRCSCGAEVVLDRFTNTCDCGRDYNMNGQELAPRCQWGEETGEHWSDIY